MRPSRNSALRRLACATGTAIVLLAVSTGWAGTVAGAKTRKPVPPTTTTTIAPTTTVPSPSTSGTIGTTPAASPPITADELTSLLAAFSAIRTTESLSQRYDAIVQREQELRFLVAASASSLTKTHRALGTERRLAQAESVESYIVSSPAPASLRVFSGVNATGAQSVYLNTAIGNTEKIVSIYLATAAAQAAQLAAQRADELQIAADATTAHTLLVQAQSAAQGALATVTSATGVLKDQYLFLAQLTATSDVKHHDDQGAAAALAVVDLLGGSEAEAEAILSADGSELTDVKGTPVASPLEARAVTAAESQVLTPYQFGSETPGVGFDCSGLTQWAWAQAGVSIARTADEQWATLPHVPLTTLQPGDLLFYFNLDGDHTVDHVTMYVGSGPYGAATVIAAPHTGAVVGYEPLFSDGLIGAAQP